MHFLGDVVIDWIISDSKVRAFAGGVANVQRGLRFLVPDTTLTTLYNPAVFPLEAVANLSASCVQDINYLNVSIRNYDSNMFRRFRTGLRTSIFTEHADVVVAHKDSCVRKFESRFCDVKDIMVTGASEFLRMGSSDDVQAIMRSISFKYAVVTYSDKVEVFNSLRKLKHVESFERTSPVDEIGAGDAFHVGFIAGMLATGDLRKAIIKGIAVAQNKVCQIGIFADLKNYEGLESIKSIAEE